MRFLPHLFLLGALVATAAGPAGAAPAKAHHTAAKAAAATKPADPTTPGGPAIPGFDARDPDSIIALLKQSNAESKVVKTESGQVVLSVTTPVGGFGVLMLGCDAKGKACRALAFSATAGEKPPTLAQVNIFNRVQLMCRSALTSDNKVSIAYATLVTQHMSQEDARQSVGVWSGCLANFGAFIKDPEGMMAKASKAPAG